MFGKYWIYNICTMGVSISNRNFGRVINDIFDTDHVSGVERLGCKWWSCIDLKYYVGFEDTRICFEV